MDQWLEADYVTNLREQNSIELADFYQKQSDALSREKPELLGLPYGTESRQTIDLFLPPTGDHHPVILFFHGGYWSTNSSASRRFLAKAWVERGVAFALANYRIAPDGNIGDMVSDAVEAMDFLVKQAHSLNISAENIIVTGNSAGAHLASMVAVQGIHQPKGLCLLSGLYDLRPLLNTSIADTLALNAHAAYKYSPMLLEPADLPAAIFAGGAETLVFKAQSEAFHAQRKAHGFPGCYHVLEGQNHFSIIAELGKVDGLIGKAISKLISSKI